MDSTVLDHLRDLISEYEARVAKFSVVMMAIQSGARAGEVVQTVVTAAAEEVGDETPEQMDDDIAETMVFSLGSAANAALNDLRFLYEVATSNPDEEV